MEPRRRLHTYFLLMVAIFMVFGFGYFLQLSPSSRTPSLFPFKFQDQINSTEIFIPGESQEHSSLESMSPIVSVNDTATAMVTIPITIEPSPSISSTDSSVRLRENSFAQILSLFDWKAYSEAVANYNNNSQTLEAIDKIEFYQGHLMTVLSPFLEMEPLIPVNNSCLPPPLPTPTNLKCQGHGNSFDGTHQSNPPKIGILIQFGFGVDVLEIYLNEVFDVVDQFFLIESTRAHFRTIRKTLLWERVKDQPRFAKFADKVVHFVVDDAETAQSSEIFHESNNLANNKNMWKMEALQESLRWSKFLQWNEAHQFFNSNDLIGFGDGDELPSRSILHMMKYCHLVGEQIDIGIWFPFGNIRQAFASDFPVLGHKYTLGDPTFWTLRAAQALGKKKGKPPGRMRGISPHFLLGGIHLTHYGYLPSKLMRDISCTECSPYPSSQILELGQAFRENAIQKLEEKYGAVPLAARERIVSLKSISDKMTEIAILPWFYDCNRNRYPTWEGHPDTRLY